MTGGRCLRCRQSIVDLSFCPSCNQVRTACMVCPCACKQLAARERPPFCPRHQTGTCLHAAWPAGHVACLPVGKCHSLAPAIVKSRLLKLTGHRDPWWRQGWLPTDTNVVACDTCSFCVHEHCDPDAQRAMGQLRMGGTKGPYNCPSCRRIREARHAIEVRVLVPQLSNTCCYC